MRAFAAIRETEGRRWIDTETISCLQEESRRKAATVDEQCGPAWANDNKYIRVAVIKLEIYQ